MKAAILLSGGIDSAAVACWKRPALAITVDYGQLAAKAEVDAASRIAAKFNIQHEVIRLDLSDLGSGSMSHRAQLQVAASPEWWPFRNQLLITLAGMFAVREACQEILIGTVLSDGLHADGRPSFIECIDTMMSNQEGGLRLRAPAALMESTELVRIAGLGTSVIALCHSCHVGNLACGQCRGCQKSREVRNAAGLKT